MGEESASGSFPLDRLRVRKTAETDNGKTGTVCWVVAREELRWRADFFTPVLTDA